MDGLSYLGAAVEDSMELSSVVKPPQPSPKVFVPGDQPAGVWLRDEISRLERIAGNVTDNPAFKASLHHKVSDMLQYLAAVDPANSDRLIHEELKNRLAQYDALSEVGDPNELAAANYELGLIYTRLYEWDKAVRAFAIARKNVVGAENEFVIATLVGQGWAHSRHLQFVPANVCFGEAVRLSKIGKVPTSLRAHVHEKSGWNLYEQGSFSDANEAFTEATKLRQAQLSDSSEAEVKALWLHDKHGIGMTLFREFVVNDEASLLEDAIKQFDEVIAEASTLLDGTLANDEAGRSEVNKRLANALERRADCNVFGKGSAKSKEDYESILQLEGVPSTLVYQVRVKKAVLLIPQALEDPAVRQEALSALQVAEQLYGKLSHAKQQHLLEVKRVTDEYETSLSSTNPQESLTQLSRNLPENLEARRARELRDLIAFVISNSADSD